MSTLDVQAVPSVTQSNHYLPVTQPADLPYVQSTRPTGSVTNRGGKWWKSISTNMSGFFAHYLWVREAFSLVIATMVVIALGIILHFYDSRSINEWPLLMNLNSFVALLVTLLYMLLMLPIAASLSQLKWNLFDSPKMLHDFQLVDQASRSIVGSARLILQKPQAYIAVFASLLTISINAIGPLVQQVIFVDLVSVPGPQVATLPISYMSFAWPETREDATKEQYSPLGNMNPYETLIQDFPNGTTSNGTKPDYSVSQVMVTSMQAPEDAINAIFGGVYSNTNAEYKVTPYCPSVNCSWPTYTSLAFQSRCVDISHRLQLNHNLNSSVSSLFPKWANSSLDINKLDPTLVQTMSSIPVISLPNGFKVTLYDIYSREAIAVADDDYLDGERRIFDDFFKGASPYHYTSMSPYGALLSLDEYTGTVLVLQTIYVETNLNANGTAIGHWNLTDKDPAKGTTFGTAAAMECAIDLAAQPLSANVSYGLFSEQEQGGLVLSNPIEPSYISSRQLVVSTYESGNKSFGCHLFLGANQTRFLGKYCQSHMTLQEARFDQFDGGNLSVDPFGTIALSTSLAHVFQGNFSANFWLDDTRSFERSTPSTRDSFTSSDAAGVILNAYANQLQTNASARSTNLTLIDVMNNTANSLTQFLRTGSNTPVKGDAYVTLAVYRVRWGWISIPAAFVALTVLVTVLTAADTKTKRVPVWTDSSIAIMVHGISESDKERLVVEKDAARLHSMAKKMVVRLGGIDQVLQTTMTDKEGIESMSGSDTARSVSPPPQRHGRTRSKRRGSL